MAKDDMTYAPKGKPNPVVNVGEFQFASTALEHGHIYGMCNGLTEASATLTWVYDPDSQKVDAFRPVFPDVRVANSLEHILDDPDVKLVATAACVTLGVIRLSSFCSFQAQVTRQ